MNRYMKQSNGSRWSATAWDPEKACGKNAPEKIVDDGIAYEVAACTEVV
jgi:hypothetical protein